MSALDTPKIDTVLGSEPTSNAEDPGQDQGAKDQPSGDEAVADKGADAEVENAKHVLQWIGRKAVTSFSVRDAYQGLKGRFKKVSELQPALKLLEEHEYLRLRREPERKGRGRRPSPAYDVNPYVHTNSGDIGNCGDTNLETNSEVSLPPEEPNSNYGTDPQNSHNPQNSPVEPTPLGGEGHDNDEVVL